MEELENQSPALAWLAVSLTMPDFFNKEMEKHVATVNKTAEKRVIEIDK